MYSMDVACLPFASAPLWKGHNSPAQNPPPAPPTDCLPCPPQVRYQDVSFVFFKTIHPPTSSPQEMTLDVDGLKVLPA
jgi:hypothetical protein